jgi:leucyl aminopeptidase
MKTKGLLLLALVLGLGASFVSADYLVRIPLATGESISRLSQPGVSVWEDLGTCAIARVRADALKGLEARGFRPQVLDEVSAGGAYYTAYAVTPAGEAVLSEWGRVLCVENGASLVWVRDPDNFVLNKGPLMLRRLGRPLVLERPQGGPSLAMPLNPFVQAMVAAVRIDSTMAALRRLQNYLNRYSTSDSCRAAVNWAANKYRAYRARIPQDTVNLFNWSSSYSQEVYFDRPGYVHPETIAVIGGHIDDMSNRGADDNGTGTVAAIEAARVMKNYDFELTARFCAFTGEEQGLLGSDTLAGFFHNRGDRIVGMLNYDMIGHVDVAPESLDVIGRSGRQDTVLMKFVKAAADSYTAMKVVFQNSGLTGSDHASFWSQGWTAFCGIEDYPLHNPAYHTQADSIGTGPNVGMNDSLWFVEAVRSGVAAFALLCRPYRSNGVEAGQTVALPRELALLPLRPNPTQGGSAIRFLLPHPTRAVVEVYDLAGRLVKKVSDGPFSPGEQEVVWDGRGAGGAAVPSGVYFVRLQASDGVRTGRLVLVR